jgi:hypothetical protein
MATLVFRIFCRKASMSSELDNPNPFLIFDFLGVGLATSFPLTGTTGSLTGAGRKSGDGRRWISLITILDIFFLFLGGGAQPKQRLSVP